MGVTKTATVTTQPGDLLVVYAASEGGGYAISTPTGNGVTFTLGQSVAISNQWCNAYIWSGVDAVGGSNWTLSGTWGGPSSHWGLTCLVFRNSSGVGASASGNVDNASPTLNLTSTQANSAVVVLSDDWYGYDGTSRVWLTVNGITPTSGNGKEIDYTFVSGIYTVYGAYYNDVGVIGSDTFGLSAPTGQRYSMVALEVKGIASPVVTAWLRA
jgi:hypothetical protein